MNKETSVAIILCTYNGEEYLEEQLDSIVNQTFKNWVIIASDDCSNDRTIDILKTYQATLGEEKLKIITGPKKGFAWNFLSALRLCHDDFDYYAFSDQDDIWLKDKLEQGINLLNIRDSSRPAIHCGRTFLINEAGYTYGKSYLFRRRPSFENALMQNIAGGNTMLINKAAKKLIDLTPTSCKVISHDWWVYILITGCGGEVIYDPIPRVLYRQHERNIIGSNTSVLSKISRIKKLFDGQFRKWNQYNINALSFFENNLQARSKKIYISFNEVRNSNLPLRFYHFFKAGFYRQTLSGNIALLVGVLLKKI